MFLCFDDLEVTSSCRDRFGRDPYFGENAEKSCGLGVHYAAKKDTTNVFCNWNVRGSKEEIDVFNKNIFSPFLMKKMRYTISTEPGDPNDSSVSPGNLSYLGSFNIDQYGKVDLRFLVEGNKDHTLHFEFHVDKLSEEDRKQLKVGQSYYLNERSFDN